jgi:acyl carrier protein
LSAPTTTLNAARSFDEQGQVRMTEQIESKVRDVLRDVLGLSQARVDAFATNTGLFGSLPELDSMAVAGLLTELEDRVGITIEDDELDGELLETFGNLVAFVVCKAKG